MKRYHVGEGQQRSKFENLANPISQEVKSWVTLQQSLNKNSSSRSEILLASNLPYKACVNQCKTIAGQKNQKTQTLLLINAESCIQRCKMSLPILAKILPIEEFGSKNLVTPD